MAVSVEIHLSGQRISLSCPYYSSEPLNGYAHSLLESLTRLLQEGHEQPIHPKGCAGVALFMKIPKCFDSHILLAFPLIENPDGSRVQHIYGIELDANLYLQRDEILQEVAHTFGAQGIRHLIPDIVSRPDPADSLQPNTSFDDLNALDKKRSELDMLFGWVWSIESFHVSSQITCSSSMSVSHSVYTRSCPPCVGD